MTQWFPCIVYEEGRQGWGEEGEKFSDHQSSADSDTTHTHTCTELVCILLLVLPLASLFIIPLHLHTCLLSVEQWLMLSTEVKWKPLNPGLRSHVFKHCVWIYNLHKNMAGCCNLALSQWKTTPLSHVIFGHFPWVTNNDNTAMWLISYSDCSKTILSRIL